MADEGLDDFFAKKDKSKKKSKPKVTPTDILSLGDADKREKKKKSSKNKPISEESNTNHGGTTKVKPEAEDEWVDFEQEAEVDYSGLKIQTLQIGKDEDEQEETRSEEEDGDEERKERKDPKSGPWKKTGAPAAPKETKIQEAPAEIAPKVEEAAPKIGGKYVPPSLRGGASATTTAAPARRKKTAPNLGSEEDFPTLGGAPRDNAQSQTSIQDPRHRNVQLTLENKFSALQDK